MKKFLFTLATIVTFGLAANAETIDFTMVGPSTYDAVKQEISIDPNGTQTARRQTFHFKAGGMDMPVIGWQIAYRATDENGNILGPDAPVHIRAVGGLYFRKETSGPSTLPENSYANNYDNAEGKQYYIALGANLTYGVVWEMEDWLDIDFGGYDAFIEELGGNDAMLAYPANVIQFQIEVDPSWEGEYVNFDFLDESHKITFYNTSSIKPTHPEFDIKVLNPNYSSTKTINGTVELGERDGYNVPVTINMVDPTEGYVVTYTINNGEAQTLTGNTIVLGEDPDYGTYNVTVTITAEGYEGSVTASKTYEIAQQTATTPTIDFVPGETGVTINVENYTSYEVIVDGVNKGQINWVDKTWETQEIVVNATNAPAGYIEATATNSTTLTAKDNYTLAGDITIGAVDENGMIYVTYTGDEEVTLTATANGEAIAVVDGYITLPDYGEYEIVVTATPTAEHTDALVSDPATRVWSAPQVYNVVAPTVAGEQTATEYVINVTNNDPYATVTLYVTTYDPETGVPVVTTYTDFPVKIARTDEDQYISFYATATLTEAPAGYDEFVNANTPAQTATIEALPELEGNVTVTVDEEGNVTATYDGDENVTIVVTPNHLDNYGEDIPVTVTVTADGYQDLVVNTTVDFIEPTPAPKLQGTLVISDHVNGAFTVTYEGTEDVEITCTITKQGAKNAVEGYNLPGYGTYDVYAKATATDPAYEGDFVDATKVLVWNEPELNQFQGTVNVTVDQLGNVTATYVPAEGEDVNPTVTVNPNHLDSFGEDIPVVVTVTADGYEPKTFNETVDYLQQTAAPSTSKAPYVFKQNGIFYNSFTVTLNGTDPDADADIYYRIGVLGEDGQYTYGDWQLYTGPFNVKQTGEIMVEAYAVADGKTPSELTYDGFTVSVATSIDELFADKAVAGVRYFNMAGQEMQEANGICIAVYNFTDGTQVAVKVMK